MSVILTGSFTIHTGGIMPTGVRSIRFDAGAAAAIFWKWMLEVNFSALSATGASVIVNRDMTDSRLWLALVKHVRAQITVQDLELDDGCERSPKEKEVGNLSTDFGMGGRKHHFEVVLSHTTLQVTFLGRELSMANGQTHASAGRH
ncbi:MAG: hypothetical protein Q7N87_05120 [Candidatus Uhrbacteria bacterium]|nr:hypothetical protein [Candidatus Uhrbacteria bacterium]MDP3793133.1 hypothetical protein [Candidatus Uhrbacteria bacterium]